jgi:hypothetical protein
MTIKGSKKDNKSLVKARMLLPGITFNILDLQELNAIEQELYED